MANHHELSNFIWQIADLLRGPYRPPQYERVMLPMTVLRRFDAVLAPTKDKVLREFERHKDKYKDDALDKLLNKAAGQRFHNHSKLTFEQLKGDPDNIDKHLTSYINGFSANVRRIFEFFESPVKSKKCASRTSCISSFPNSATPTCIPTAWTISRWGWCLKISSAVSTNSPTKPPGIT